MIRAPAEGLVLTRNVSPGQWFDRGAELYRIADLTRIWILADAFENEAQHLRPGVRARISLPQQGKAFHATVSAVPPQFDATSRTLKVRLEMDNPGSALRPDMFVDVELPVNYPATITVPADAVVDSGVKKTVYVAKGDGLFEPRKVETGWRAGDRVEIVKGLMPGEKIVVSGTFLIDSESRMRAAAAGPRGETSEDPVCGMDVDQAKAKAAGLTSEFRGQTYYFCSTEDKAKFDKEPTKYSGKAGKDATTEAGKRLGNVQWEGGKAKDPESAHVGHAHPPAMPSEHSGHQHP
jgi:YHS domain-containing protein